MDTSLSFFSNLNVVVTGGSGFIGSHLARYLAGSAASVTVADINEPVHPVAGTRYVNADLRCPDQARVAMTGADVVFHLAGNPDAVRSVANPAADFEANALTTLQSLKAAQAAGARRFVHMSSALVYGRPPQCPVPESAQPRPVFPYANSKLAAERLVCAFGSHRMSCAIARTFVVYGPDEPKSARGEVSQYIRMARRGQGIQILGDPDVKTRDFVHVADVARALAAIGASQAAGVINVGTGTETSLRELAGIVAFALGIPLPRMDVVPSPSDEYRLVADITRLAALGTEPEIGLADGVRQVARACGAGEPASRSPQVVS